MLWRGIEKAIEKEEIEEVIRKKNARIKLGIDPTAPLIHLGHLVLLMKLRKFQEIGCEVILIVGDFTARIGDPSGRKKVRPVLSEEEIKKNSEKILQEVLKFLIKDRTKIYFNSEWFSSMTTKDFLEILSRFSLQRIIEREDFKERIKEGLPVYTHEIIYPILQGYDSIVVRADIEIGGQDQLFNLLVGREMMRDFGIKPQSVITMPLLEGLDGKLKMSKTYMNYISTEEKPEDIFGKLMGIPDELIKKYALLLTDLTDEEIDNFGSIHPFYAKSKVAFKITSLLCGEENAKKAKDWFDNVIRERKTPDEIPEYEVSVKILRKVLKSIGLVKSVSEAVRIIESGGVYINSERVKDINYEVKDGDIIRVGKIGFAKIKIKS